MAEKRGIESPVSHSGKDVKSPQDRNKAATHGDKSSPRHHKETHGMSEDIDKDTPVDEVKGPIVFQRVKEEVEAVAETVLHKKK